MAQLEALRSDMVDMAAGFKFLGPERLESLYGDKPGLLDANDGSAYSAVHQAEHLFFQQFVAAQNYEDILLVDPAGCVFYTLRKGAAFGADLKAPLILPPTWLCFGSGSKGRPPRRFIWWTSLFLAASLRFSWERPYFRKTFAWDT